MTEASLALLCVIAVKFPVALVLLCFQSVVLFHRLEKKKTDLNAYKNKTVGHRAKRRDSCSIY